MSDTSPQMQKKQLEILFSKTLQERFLIGTETINFGRTLIESSIIQSPPKISELDLRIEVLKRCYSSVFKQEEIELIISSYKNYYLRKSKIEKIRP